MTTETDNEIQEIAIEELLKQCYEDIKKQNFTGNTHKMCAYASIFLQEIINHCEDCRSKAPAIIFTYLKYMTKPDEYNDFFVKTHAFLDSVVQQTRPNGVDN